MTIPRKNTIIVLAIILLVGVFYGFTLREGHLWGGDFSQYIHHAKNIAEGRAYHETGYIYNPHYSTLGPKTFPPVFSFILVPSYYWFGLNLTAMKYSVMLFFLLALWCIHLSFRGALSFPYLIATLGALGFHPYFWEFKDEILSDFPFLCFVYLGFFLIQKAYQAVSSPRKEYALWLGLTIYLAYGTRSLGLILFVSLIVYDVIHCRRVSGFVARTSLVLSILLVLQGIFFHNDRSYVDQFMQINLQSSLQNALLYAKRFSLFWNNGYSHAARHVLFIATAGMALFAYGIRVKKALSIFEIFSVLYIAVIIVFPFGQMRYLIPLFPLYLFYLFWGIQHFQRSPKKAEAAKWSFGVLALIFLVSYAGQYSKVDYGPISEGMAKKETVELFKFIKSHTDKDDVVFFRKPRVLTLFTGRKASYSHESQTDEELWNYFRKIEAEYLIIGTLDTPRIFSFVERHRGTFELVYANPDFYVYKIV
ncbi:MAG: hypothetical protein GY801_30480 [bacterium]|nr:hypothetical protein [bacterium]